MAQAGDYQGGGYHDPYARPDEFHQQSHWNGQGGDGAYGRVDAPHDPYGAGPSGYQQHDTYDPHAGQFGGAPAYEPAHPGYDNAAAGYDPHTNGYAEDVSYGPAAGYPGQEPTPADPYAPQFAPFDPHAPAGAGHAGHDPFPPTRANPGFTGGDGLSTLRPRGGEPDAYGQGQAGATQESADWTGRQLPDSHAGFSAADTASVGLRGPAYDDRYGSEPQFEQAASSYPADAAGAGYRGAQHYGADQGNYIGGQQAYATGYSGPMDGTDAHTDTTSFDPNGFQLDPGLRHAPASGEQTALEVDDDEYDDEYDEPRRSTAGRVAMIAGALVGAIAVGGGLAYGYKTFFGPNDSPKTSQTAVVKSPSGPTKVRPAEPGGRQFSHTDSKIMDRLGGGGAGTAAGSVGATGSTAAPVTPVAARDANGARKVAVIPIGRDGSIRQPAATQQASSPSPSSGSASSVDFPGLTVVGPLGGETRPAPSSPPASRNALSPARPASPLVVRPPDANSKPVVIANASPVTKPAATTPDFGSTTGAGATRVVNPITGRQVAVPAPDRKGNVPPDALNRVAVSRIAPPATTAATTRPSAPRSQPSTAGAASFGSGYVVVLASIPQSSSSRMDALARFADIQQSYGGVLNGKSPEVKAADLGARGRYHRLMVGPPTSSEAAAKLCADLKSAGYSGCWVTTY